MHYSSLVLNWIVQIKFGLRPNFGFKLKLKLRVNCGFKLKS